MKNKTDVLVKLANMKDWKRDLIKKTVAEITKASSQGNFILTATIIREKSDQISLNAKVVSEMTEFINYWDSEKCSSDRMVEAAYEIISMNEEVIITRMADGKADIMDQGVLLYNEQLRHMIRYASEVN